MNISLENILNSMPVGILVVKSDGVVAHANRQAGSLLNFSPPLPVGLHVDKFWPRSAAEVMEVVRSGRQAAGLLLPELDGCFIQSSPVSGGEGAAFTIFDYRLWQPRFGARQTLDPLTPYLKRIFESSSDGFSIVDSQGRLLMVNQASGDNLGVPPESIVGRHVTALIDQNISSDVLSLDIIRERKSITRLIKNYKTGRQVLITGTPVFNPQGEVHLVVLNERDITAMTRLQTSFQQQKKVLDKFKEELNALQLSELERRRMVAESPSMNLVLAAAIKLAHHGVGQILITGESGTGKGLLAKFIHARSQRKDEPFTHINCAALPESLLESELFGYEKGAFTGAAASGRAGLFEITGTGTVFLDEIGELPLPLQAKILTFLDNGEFRRVGGHETIKASCAVITATNQNLEKLAAENKFRQDLFFRLDTFGLHIPPLRERREDAVELARQELARLNSVYGQKRRLDPLAIEVLHNYEFPGNIRELLSALSQAVLLSESVFIGAFLKKTFETRKQAGQPGRSARNGNTARVSESAAALRGGGSPPRLNQSLHDVERERLVEALACCRSTRDMANFLGISQASVSRRLKRLGLTPPNPPKRTPASK